MILLKSYDKWREDPFHYFDVASMEIDGVDKERVMSNAEYLAQKGLIESPQTMRFITKITVFGIDQIEDKRVSYDVEIRRRILQMLKELHDEAPQKSVNKKRLMELSGFSEIEIGRNTLYLDKTGLADVDWAMGGYFSAEINARGIDFLKKPTLLENQTRVMSYAYSILFELETKLRVFVERKLRTKYGNQWWIKGVTQKDIQKAEKRKSLEPSSNSSLINYTEFGDLQRIIINNWDVFKEYFVKQQRIVGRLDELEPIRNIIAHSRLLSNDQLEKLELFLREINKMMGETY